MGKRKLKKIEAKSKLTWAEWLIERKETLSLQDESPPDSNFILHDHSSQGFAGTPSAFSPGVFLKSTKQQKKTKKGESRSHPVKI
ncbi:MAG: hypothetical protein ACXADB_03345 [Candidatus Hermodarchaeia archaeon]